MTNNEGGARTEWPFAERFGGGPEALAAGDLHGRHLAALVEAIDNTIDNNGLHIDGRNGCLGQIAPNLLRPRLVLGQLEQQVLVAVAGDEKMLANHQGRHDDGTVAGLVGGGPVLLAGLGIE